MLICSQVHLTEESGQHQRLRCPWRQEARRKAVLGARRLVGRPSWTPGGPSEGRLGRQEARREAVLGARRPVGRPSWAPGGPSGGRFGRQEARRAALGQEAPGGCLAPGGPTGGRLGRQKARTVGFADSCSENAGFAQAAGPELQNPVPTAPRPTAQFLYRLSPESEL